MKIVFIGTVEFSLKSLEKLLDIGADIVGVCTKESSSSNSDFADLVPLSKEKNIPYNYVEDINSKENISWIKKLKPDIIFCFGYSQLLKKELLHVAPMGVLGYHPAALPQNRGRHPIIWALALGLDSSASTFFFMNKYADSGDILSQESFKIEYEDNAFSVYNKVINTALKQMEIFLPELQNNTYKKIKQNHSNANSWRKRSKKDGKIDFRMDSTTIYNLVRSLSKPYVGSHIEYKDENISIWAVKVIEFNQNNIEFGKVLDVNNDIITIKTSDGAVQILEHEFKVLPKVGEYL